MNLDFNTEYIFKTVSEPEYPYLYELQFIGSTNIIDESNLSYPNVINNLLACEYLTFNYAENSIFGVDLEPYLEREEIAFHLNLNFKTLLGEDIKSGCAIQCHTYGAKDIHGCFVVSFMGIKVSPMIFDNVNIINCPSPEYAQHWHEALKAKSEDRFYDVTDEPESEKEII